MALDTACFEMRNACAGDIDDIIQFLNERGSELLLSGSIESKDERWRERWLDPFWTRILVIRSLISGAVVGVVAMHVRHTWRRGIGTIEYVLSDPQFRDCGLGRAMMLEIIRQALKEVQPPISKLELVCELHRKRARRFYISLGFVFRKDSPELGELDLSNGYPLVV